MKALAIIPSRYQSSRFPGKPLATIGGKAIVMWVYEAVKSSNLFADVYVATDDERIQQHVIDNGGNVLMTSSTLSCGTERCEQSLSILEKEGKTYDVVVNVQGDEPLIKKEQLQEVLSGFEEKDADIVTLAKAIEKEEDVDDRNVVKLVKANNRALYFSRSRIPCNRDAQTQDLLEQKAYNKHIGIYAYRAEVLHKITKLEQSPLEKIEKLEQLRWLEAGYNIIVKQTNIDTIGVDTPQDLENIKKIIEK